MKVYLIGFMASGKSYLGQLIAEKMALEFIDLDKRIEEKFQCEIREIFEKKGEKVFRDIEHHELLLTKSMDNCIISTGGGIVERIENRIFLEKERVIFLEEHWDIILKRLSGDKTRPKNSTPELLKKLYQSRLEYYRENAEILKSPINADVLIKLIKK